MVGGKRPLRSVTVRHSEGPPFRRVTLTVTVRVSRVSVMVSVRDSVK